MAEQSRQVFIRAFLHSFAEQLLHFEHRGILDLIWIEHAPDAALAGLLPSFHPITYINGAIGTELHVRAKKAANEFAFVVGFEARAFGAQREGMNKTVRAPVKVAEEKMPVIARRQTGARIIACSPRARGNMDAGGKIR